jgi:predicted RNA-binding Zn-ribbon protein involved in translation (DUF1610 family)
MDSMFPLEHFSSVANPENQQRIKVSKPNRGYGETELIRCRFCQKLRSVYKDVCPQCGDHDTTANLSIGQTRLACLAVLVLQPIIAVCVVDKSGLP